MNEKDWREMNEIERLRYMSSDEPIEAQRHWRLEEQLFDPRIEGGFVYLIQLGNTDHYKIGITRDIHKRLNQLQSKCPVHLKVIYSRWGHDYKSMEAYLHFFFNPKRIKGEWFQLTSIDLLIIVDKFGNDNKFPLHPSRRN